MKPLISIVVPAYNEEELLTGCLASLLDQDLDRTKYEIILVNNASTDDTEKIAKEYGVRVINESRKGYVYAVKKGTESAGAPIIAMTDADCTVPRDWLSNLLALYNNDPGLVAIGGGFSLYDGSWLMNKVSELFSRLYLNSACGGNMSFRVNSYYACGGYDPNYNMGADFILCHKLRKVGRVRIIRRLKVATSARRFIYSSPRELFSYLLNGASLIIFKRPLFSTFPDIRPKISRGLALPLAIKLVLFSAVMILSFTVVYPSVSHSQTPIHQKIHQSGKSLALTFDDGPDPQTTPKILTILKEKQIKATFFLVGKKVDQNPKLAQEIVAEGHTISNHSYNHRLFSGLDRSKQMKNDFDKSATAIQVVTGVKPRLLRTPHGFDSTWFNANARKHNYVVVAWDLDSLDWLPTSSSRSIENRVLKEAKSGDIVDMHDGLDFKVGTQEKLVKALPQIIDGLKAQGYSFVTVDELMKTKAYEG